MKVILCDDSHYEIFLNQISSFPLENKEKLEEELKRIFLKLERFYHINVSGFYHVILYHDSNYGIVLNVEKEEIDYYQFSIREIDLRIQIEENPFLYKIEDYYYLTPSLLKKGEVYSYHNDFYYIIKKPLTKKERIYLSEYSILTFLESNQIIKKQNIIKKEK